MADAAHEWTDEQIEALTKRMRDAYEEAAAQMSDKLEKFLAEYDERKNEMKDRLKAGKIGQDEYDNWLKSQSYRHAWLQQMVDELALDATNVDEIAMGYINDDVPRIYCENANYSFYGIETEVGFDTHAWTLYDQKTVQLLLADPEATRIPTANIDKVKDTAWNSTQIRKSLTQSIIQGESISNAAKRLIEESIFRDYKAATRTARTVLTSAENAGRQESYRVADKIGIKVEKEWYATLDVRTRLTHRQMHRKHVPYDKPFLVDGQYEMMYPADPAGPPHECYNCFVGSTKVRSDSRIIRSYKHLYVGELLTIKTASGVEFACTPNHPILTPSGWVAAKGLNLGDDVCVALGGGDMVGGNPCVDHVMPSMEAVHELVSMLADKRTCLLGVDFHGDVPASDVEIVGEERLLREDWDSVFRESITKFLLEYPDSSASALGALLERVCGIVGASSGRLSREGVLLSFLEGHSAHPEHHGIRRTPTLYPSISKNARNDVPRVPDSLGDGEFGLTAEIGVDNIIDIKVSSTDGTHVYNLQTANGYYFVSSKDNGNSIIAHNCRCTMMKHVVETEGEVTEVWSNLPKGLTYEEWLEGKGKPAPKKKKKKKKKAKKEQQ